MNLLALFAAILMSIGQSGQTWTGRISDSACGAKHVQGEGVEEMTEPECSAACIRGGSRYVFIAANAADAADADAKVYQIANQNDPSLPKFAGLEVRLTGEIKDNSITISKLEKVEN